MFCLLVGFATGLSRMGWDLNILATSLHHGAIMVGGFLGTLISLEKVIPLRRKILLAIPAMSGASVILFLLGIPTASFVLLVLASASLSGVFLYYLAKGKELIYVLMSAGGLCWLTGNLILMNMHFYPSAFPWWLGFMLFIITSERLELTKFLPVKNSMKGLLAALLIAYLAGVVISFHSGGQVISGFALVAIALWLMNFDLVAISIRKGGLQKFIGIALLAGYVAMMLTGIFMIASRQQVLAYDATLHTFFLGFVFSMIFAHGPIILPGVLGISAKPWHRILYLWLFLLHSSWMMRVVADVFLDFNLRKMSGWITTLGITGYFVSMGILTMRSQGRHAKEL